MRRLACLTFAACLFLLVRPAAATSVEAVFREALAYTVQVRTAVTMPFGTDVKGTQRGSGFVVDAGRGWILTNAHVVSRSPSRIEVATHDGGYVAAARLYVDPHLDLAVLEVPPQMRSRLSAARLNCGEDPGIGHPVGAFGHPWNIRFTGTRGIVSGSTVRRFAELMQTDAPINAGNSGGPLISLETGAVIGINTAQIRGSQNTNFAVSARYACRILELMRAGHDPSPPDLLLSFFRESEESRGLKVARNHAPESLDLRNGDLIRGVEGHAGEVRNETQLLHALRGRLDGFVLRIERDGAQIQVTGRAAASPSPSAVSGVFVSGVLVSLAPFGRRDELFGGALMVHHIEPGSDGNAADLMEGDLVEHVNGVHPGTLADLERALSQSAGGQATLTLRRFIGAERSFAYLERRLAIDTVRIIGQIGNFPSASTDADAADIAASAPPHGR